MQGSHSYAPANQQAATAVNKVDRLRLTSRGLDFQAPFRGEEDLRGHGRLEEFVGDLVAEPSWVSRTETLPAQSYA